MADIIEVNFKEKRKILKYTIRKNVCVICFNSVIYDTRKENNDPYVEVSKNKGQCICQKCCIRIKEIVDENEWDK